MMNLLSVVCVLQYTTFLIIPQPVKTSFSPLTYSTAPNNNFEYGNQIEGSGSSRRRPSPSIMNPVELVSFQLMDDQDDKSTYSDGDQSSSNYLERSRYDWAGRRDKNRRPLPLLSRGERETDFDDYLDGEKVPSCRELRKMWKLARKIHQRVSECFKMLR